MTEEEKKAIETLECFEPIDLVECSIYLQCIEKIKNLIEKQQKEIEEKTEQVKMLDEAYSGAIKESKKWFDVAQNSVSKRQ